MPMRKWLGKQRGVLVERLGMASVSAAVREYGLEESMDHLSQIVPDIEHQYSRFSLDSPSMLLRVRALHAFQVALANEAIGMVDSQKASIRVVDIGDSAGTHIQYLLGLHKDRQLDCMSVNIDEEALQKIREKGLNAVQASAEDLGALGIDADVFMCFEVLEHLTNPIQFLKDLSGNTHCRALVLTVPYVSQSRVGLHQIRASQAGSSHPESTHIFELSPEDWELLFKHAGWSVGKDRLFLRYPTKGPLRLMRYYWKRDLEGFWGAILRRDSTWSKSSEVPYLRG